MPLPILSVQQMRAWEAATWANGQTEKAVIAMVGKAVARKAIKMTRRGDRILILAGKGHNGDDARAALKHLKNRKCEVVNVDDPSQALEKIKPADLIIDALFGIGLNRSLSQPWRTLIKKINETRSPILSVDVPSGLNADTGEHFGEIIRADVTLTVGAPKKGFLQARNYVGRLEVAENVGLAPLGAETESRWITKNDFINFPGRRPIGSHKGNFGHLAIIAGSLGYHGAAVLAARGAARAQPGLISVFTEKRSYLAVASQLQSQMVHPWTGALNFPAKISAILFGPGLAAEDLSPAWKKSLRNLWRSSPIPVIADASGLAFLPRGKISSKAPRLITPHPGEAARLLDVEVNDIEKDRAGALRKISNQRGNCWVVLKGHQTLIGKAEGNIMVNSSGNPFLAQGGSGDLLAGFLGGLLAQPDLARDFGRTINFGVWEHGASADRLGQRKKNWTVEDLAKELGKRK